MHLHMNICDILRDYMDAGCVVSRVTVMVFPYVQTNNQVEEFGCYLQHVNSDINLSLFD